MERRCIDVRGTVQGVGFRPFVYGLASQLALGGFVRNQAGGVTIEVEGEPDLLDQFLVRLGAEPPPLAHIDALSWEARPLCGERDFRIERSGAASGSPIVIAPDTTTCRDCLAELFNPADRRYQYPFLNCTNCGPRLTIITAAPYDRERTTMAAFPMCNACRAEYENPADRRFHAQPIACPVCGPRLNLCDNRGQTIPADDAIAAVVAALRDGKIAAIKGLGGYHLACDARNSAAVAELRRRKHRDEKPFAIMLADVAAVEAVCELAPAGRHLLTSRRRPIVLLRKRVPCDIAIEAAGDKNPFLGIMLPYTPLHHLLLRAADGMPLVMTSANRSDEPIAYEDADALSRLADIADIFLIHNRPIHIRCDDSVTRMVGNAESPIRRSRGYAPQPIRLPVTCAKPILAVGGQLKVAFALGQETQAIISQHMGDLDYFEAYQAFQRDISRYEQLFQVRPQCIAHDMHPDYASTLYALGRARQDGIETIAIQHHHAHIASCMAEHGLDERVIGVAFDGSGYGTDGTIWGGEFFVGNYDGFVRAAHLRCVGIPGGERAIHEPWRMAIAHLRDAQIDCPSLVQRLPPTELRAVNRMLERKFNTPTTSSVGRLFDAVAAIAGLRDRVSYEGQAAMELEWLAMQAQPCGSYPFALEQVSEAGTDTWIVDTQPLIKAVAQDVNGAAPPKLARRFHATMVELIAEVCGRLRTASGIDRVVLSGGVFMNTLLSSEADTRLASDKFSVYRHRLVPPNDGGLSLGQLAIAAWRSAPIGTTSTNA